MNNSFSRRLSFFKFAIPLLLALFFVALLKETSRRTPWYEQALWALLAPPQKALVAVGDWFSEIWDGHIYLVGLRQENQALSRENAQLKGQLIGLAEVKQENQRLRDLLNYSAEKKLQGITAQVIANDSRAQFKSLMLNRGSADGVKLFMPVVVGEGLIGRIGKVSKQNSIVLLINDPNSAVDVILQRSRSRAVLVGNASRGQSKARLEYLLRTSDAKEGDQVVTSGFDGVYPAGLPVGKISKVLSSKTLVFQEAQIELSKVFSSVQEVLILKFKNKELAAKK